jgi:ectoine hydroxylase-related dioxygenase (phytanoyl-CoA dioxygenase family)
VPLATGDAVGWHRYTVHGSGENRSSRSRKGVVVVFAPARLLDPMQDPIVWHPSAVV